MKLRRWKAQFGNCGPVHNAWATTLRILAEDEHDNPEAAIQSVSTAIKTELKDAKEELTHHSVHISKYSTSECTSPTLANILSYGVHICKGVY